MSEIVKRLRKAHDENMDRSFSPPLETQTSVDFHYAALKIEDLEAEITRLTTALENARKDAELLREDLKAAKSDDLRNLNGEYDHIKLEYYNKGLEDAAAKAIVVAGAFPILQLPLLNAIRSLTPPKEKAT